LRKKKSTKNEKGKPDKTTGDPENSMSAVSYYYKAVKHCKAWECDEAKECLIQSTKMDPTFTEAFHHLAMCYFETEEYHKCIRVSERLLSHKAYLCRAWYFIFNSYYFLQKYEQADIFYKIHIAPVPIKKMKGNDRELRKKIEKGAFKVAKLLEKEESSQFGYDEGSVMARLIREFEEMRSRGTGRRVKRRQTKKTTSVARARSRKIEKKKAPTAKIVKEAAPQKQTKKTEKEKPEKAVLQPLLVELPEIKFKYTFDSGDVLKRLRKGIFEDPLLCDIRLTGERIMLLRGFEDLICLNTLSGVEQYWYQIETVKRVLKYFRGRSLLCDEVGLGKTIEAGMIMKEYLLRGLAKRILILTPTSLIPQWKIEMQEKFDIEFATTQDDSYSEEPKKFWKENPRIIASLPTARSKRNFPLVAANEYDLVIVDEAHHAKNRRTISWKLINSLKKRFILLLTATPVQNDLMELYNLITLLAPGTLSTPSQFRKEFVKRGNPREPLNMEKLRELLLSVMIRNTRAMVDIKLPPRYASTYRVEQNKREAEIYKKANGRFIKNADHDSPGRGGKFPMGSCQDSCKDERE